MQPYPWWTLYLEPSILCQIWDSPPDYLIEMRQLVSIQKFNSAEVLNTSFFLAVGTSLVLVAACFYSKFNSKKVLQIWFFQLLAQSWFQWQPFSSQNSIQKSIEKIHFPAFGPIFVSAAAFFCKKIAKKYKKDTSSKRSHTLGEPYT